jgi:hypothetical protein
MYNSFITKPFKESKHDKASTKKISHRQNASKSNRKMVEKDKIDTANTQILDRYFPDLVQAFPAMVRSSASSSNMVLSVPIY